MKGYFVAVFFAFYSIAITAQQLAKHNLYHYNLNYINPAATGCSPCKVFNIADKHEWVGIAGAPSLQVISAQLPKPVNKYKKHGLGLNLLRDKNGAVQNLNGELAYSFHMEFGWLRKQILSFGLAGNFGQLSFDERDFTQNIFDPAINRGVERELTYNASAGVYLYNNKYYAGIGVYNLLPIGSSLYQGYGNDRFFTTALAGYNIQARNKRFMLKTSVYGCRDNNMFQFDINNHFYFNNKVWAGLTLRKYMGGFFKPGQNALLFLGYEMDKWGINYAYDIGINGLQRRHFGSQQLSISYKICRDKYACPAY